MWVFLRQIGVIAALGLVALILWIDIATGLWQDYVILSGLAAGVVTFVLTALVIDRIVARSTHRRWAPVTKLAMYDILHALADDDASEIARGRVVPRQFSLVDARTVDGVIGQIDAIRDGVVAERQKLSAALAAWSTFLASSADATEVLDRAAEIAERLDLIRDAALETEGRASAEQVSLLNQEMALFNDAVHSLVVEVQRLIASTGTVARRVAARPAVAQRSGSSA